MNLVLNPPYRSTWSFKWCFSYQKKLTAPSGPESSNNHFGRLSAEGSDQVVVHAPEEASHSLDNMCPRRRWQSSGSIHYFLWALNLVMAKAVSRSECGQINWSAIVIGKNVSLSVGRSRAKRAHGGSFHLLSFSRSAVLWPSRVVGNKKKIAAAPGRAWEISRSRRKFKVGRARCKQNTCTHSGVQMVKSN